jgi:hypothetical protein
MGETDGYDTPRLAQELDLGSPSEPMDVQPDLDSEKTDPNLGPDQIPTGADPDDEEVFYDCRSQSTEEIEECGVGVGNPPPRGPA